MKNKVPLIFSVVCLVIGFMIAIQFQANNEVVENDPRDMNELRINLQKERERTQVLLNEISKNDQLLYQYEMSMNKDDDIADVMAEELKRLKRIAGLEDIVGKGAVIRIEENKENWDEEQFFTPLVYDEDLRMIVNELNAYGAKAISINDQRIISTSAIRNVGDRILVNTIPILPPYEIKVIGDHSILIPALKLAGLDQYFMVVNHVVQYESREYLRIKGYNQTIETRYLEPVKEDNG